MAASSANLNSLPHTPSASRAAVVSSRLPLSNRGVGKDWAGEQLERAKQPEPGTWCGIDWVAGSCDLLKLLDQHGWDEVRTPGNWERGVLDDDTLAAVLSAYGPRPKPKGAEADADPDTGELVAGRNYVFVPPPPGVEAVARSVFAYLFAGTGLVLAKDATPGKFYAFRWMLRNVWDQPAGMIELGGCLTKRKGGRPSVRFELTGMGCAILEQRGDVSADHAERWCAFATQLRHVDALLSRVDVAFDDFSGQRAIAHAKAMYETGEFDYRFAGELHRPKAKGFDDYGSGDGSTFYVGHSSSEKQLRVYEKGKQLGDRESPWVRWEMQMRGSTRKRLALDVLRTPQDYMRGAYQCLDFVSSCMARLEVTKQATKACIKSVLRHAKRMYGATFNQLRLIAPDGQSWAELIETLSVDTVPRWAKTGRLTWADVLGLDEGPRQPEETVQ